VLLEPIVEADIRVPEKSLGAIMSDINGGAARSSAPSRTNGTKKCGPRSGARDAAVRARPALDHPGPGNIPAESSRITDEMPQHLAKGIIEDSRSSTRQPVRRPIKLRRDRGLSAPSAHDVCVIGGGVTGAGIARDLSCEAFPCCCLEKGDWELEPRAIHAG